MGGMMGFIAPLLSVVGTLMGGMGNKAPEQAPPPPPPQIPPPEEDNSAQQAADAEAAKARSIRRRKDAQSQRNLLSLDEEQTGLK